MPSHDRSDFKRQQSQAKEEERLRRAGAARHLAQRYARPYRASDLIRTLNDIARRVTRAARKFDAVTRRMTRAVPPGDGFYWVKVLSRRECSVYPVGKSALSDVVVRVVDLDQEPADPFGRVARIGRLKPLHGAVLDLGVDWMQRSPRSVDLYFTARQGSFTQEIRGYHLPNGDWSWASRTQTASGKLVDLDVPEGFPVKEAGIEDWLLSVPMTSRPMTAS